MVGFEEGIWLSIKLAPLVFLIIEFFLVNGLFDRTVLLVAPDCLAGRF
jgi:hypothetical protein